MAWFLIGRICGSSECVDYYCPSDRRIEAPEGYEFVSRIFEYNTKLGAVADGNDLAIAVELTKPVSDGSALSFYRYVDETKNWEPISPAVLDSQGSIVSATFSGTPSVMAVMRRTAPGGRFIAYLPHNATLHPEAAGRVSIVHPLDFKPAADGAITGELSTTVQQGNYDIYPVVSANSSVQGDVEIVENILASADSRANHAKNIVDALASTNVKGVDIAYLDLPVTARTSFTLFVGLLYEQLHAQNKQLTLTLPAPIKAQNRLDEGAYDWAELAKTADLLQIAPYRDQATYRLTMPEILQYLTERVPPSKLILTVSPYATETGGDTIQTMSIAQAMSIATSVTVRAEATDITTSTQVKIAGTNIDKDEGLTGVRWSADTATVAFSYKQPQGAGSRTIYIENFFSIGFKLELIGTYKLGGVAVEDASSVEFLGDIWSALVPYVSSGQPILMQPNSQDLNPRWAVTDGQGQPAGQIEDTSRGSAMWSTPAQPGTYTISLTLSDGVALFQNSIEVNVKARPATQSPSGTTTPGQ
ncbi:MAG: glycosyl hydrolase family 18 protein [Dehalococcoidia bacterium]